MQRIVEAELMNDKFQAEAYASADFEASHQLIIQAAKLHFPDLKPDGYILDLGCGPGDITFRFASHVQNSFVIGVDGSTEMIKLAEKRKASESGLGSRISFIKGILPGASIPRFSYSAIVSNSFLHHLHRPETLWDTILQYSSPGTKILITDLFRPDSPEDAKRLVKECSANEPLILQEDFYNSLLAAFTIEEIEQQLIDTDLLELKVEQISDRHLLIFGEKTEKG